MDQSIKFSSYLLFFEEIIMTSMGALGVFLIAFIDSLRLSANEIGIVNFSESFQLLEI